MSRRVKGPDGVVHEFPDDATDAEISAALERRAPVSGTANIKKPRTWTDTAVDALPAVGGAVGGIVGGIGGTVGGFGIGGIPGSIGGAALGGATGESARQLVNRARGANAPATMGQAARDIGVEGGIQGGSQLIGWAIGQGAIGAARHLAPGLMQSALKPGIRSTLGAVRTGQVPPVVRTLLDEGVNVTPGGIEKLNGIIGASNTAITSAISGLGGTPISPLRVAGRLTDTARKFGNQVNPQADLEAISTVGHNFLEAQAAPLSASAAQSLKTGTYKAIGSRAYGETKGATLEAEKALARGLKEEIAAEAQRSGIDLGALNAREGAAITARDAIAKRVAQVGNRDPAGLAWLAHNPVTFLMAVMERSPVVKSYLARSLWQAAAKASGMPVEAFKFSVGAIASKANQEPQ